ncbi:hypothetical protein BCR36DRAFT_585959 [Piromyces finnis]|uniref:Uncharacterized protein n=1 Tax=Piromyces finnis TaxID=1754191 RepID=A0A1Y1V1A0_9FUNG|nr:hypothetical protein BCR36DRAFT_585959 [Piromyces finnis]|eukprot:ORX44846.1 hypothetical protein BCR36DRAFT_585959 [Piromyces finnis]
MKFTHIIFVITFILTIKIYKVNCRPRSSWESSSSWSSHTSSDGTTSYTSNEHSSSQVNGKTVSEVNKSNTVITKPDGTTYKQNNNVQSKPQSQSQSKPQPQPQPQQPKSVSKPKSSVTQVKPPIVTTVKPKITKTTTNPIIVASTPVIQQKAPPPPIIAQTPTTTSVIVPVIIPSVTSTIITNPTVNPIINPSITNICAQQCSTIYSKCQYFSTLSNLNDYTLENIYPPPQNNFGECLCKSEQNHIGFYSVCTKCLLTLSNNSELNITDQVIQTQCKAFDKTEPNLIYNNNNSTTDIKNVNNISPVALPETKSFNPTNLIIICSIVGGILTVYGGIKFRNYIKDKRRESLPMY